MPEPQSAEATPKDRRAAQAAAAAAAAAAVASGAPAPILPMVPVANIAAASALVAGLLASFMAKAATADNAFVLKHVAGRTTMATDIETVLAEEAVRGETFRKLALQRLQRDMPVALALPDETQRAAAVQGILNREQVYQRMRSEAMASRSFAAVDRMVLRRESPGGAFWKLDPDVQEHTAGCLILGGRFWSWDILDRVHPPRHPGCPCRLIGYDEAVKLGLLKPGDVMDLADQVKATAGVVMEAVVAEPEMVL